MRVKRHHADASGMDVIMMWYLLPALGGRFPRNIQRHQNEPAAITFQACEDPQDDLEERFRRLIGKNVPHQGLTEKDQWKNHICANGTLLISCFRSACGLLQP